jgi:hypothetical protein
MHPQNMMIVWFSIMNLNPWFKAWWEIMGLDGTPR